MWWLELSLLCVRWQIDHSKIVVVVGVVVVAVVGIVYWSGWCYDSARMSQGVV